MSIPVISHSWSQQLKAYMNTERVHSVCHTLCIISAHSQKLCASWLQTAWLPDLGTMLSSSGTSASTVRARAWPFPYSYFPCGEAHAQPKLRRHETDDGGDKRGLCGALHHQARGNYRWGVWSNDGLMDPMVKDLPVLSPLHSVPFCLGHNFSLRWSDLLSTKGCDWAHSTHRKYFHRSSYFSPLPWRASSDHCIQMSVDRPAGIGRLNCSRSFVGLLLSFVARIRAVPSWFVADATTQRRVTIHAWSLSSRRSH